MGKLLAADQVRFHCLGRQITLPAQLLDVPDDQDAQTRRTIPGLPPAQGYLPGSNMTPAASVSSQHQR
jgi:hypothetical protein